MPKQAAATLTTIRTERATRPGRQQRYPFATLKPPVKNPKTKEIEYDTFFVADPTKEKTLRSQASRRGKALKREFSVSRGTGVPEGGTEPVEGLRIYRTK